MTTAIQRNIKPKKIEAVSEISSILSGNKAIVVTNYHGLTVSDIFKLRSQLRALNGKFTIIKSSLVKIAIGGSGKIDGSAKQLFTGPVAVAYSNDMISISKSLSEFATTNSNLKIIGCILDNEVCDASKVERYSKLPTMDESRAKIIALLTANASKLISLLIAKSKKE